MLLDCFPTPTRDATPRQTLCTWVDGDEVCLDAQVHAGQMLELALIQSAPQRSVPGV